MTLEELKSQVEEIKRKLADPRINGEWRADLEGTLENNLYFIAKLEAEEPDKQ